VISAEPNLRQRSGGSSSMVASQGPNEGEIVEFNLIHWPRFAGRRSRTARHALASASDRRNHDTRMTGGGADDRG
jgi:hypothetical protein